MVVSSSVVPTLLVQDLGSALGWLSSQPLVHFLEPHMLPQQHNIYAGMVAQTGYIPTASKTDVTNEMFHPFWRLGLDGTGQVLCRVISWCGGQGLGNDLLYC